MILLFFQGQVTVELSESVKRDVEFNAKNFSKMGYVEVLPTLNSRELASYVLARVSVKNFIHLNIFSKELQFLSFFVLYRKKSRQKVLTWLQERKKRNLVLRLRNMTSSRRSSESTSRTCCGKKL